MIAPKISWGLVLFHFLLFLLRQGQRVALGPRVETGCLMANLQGVGLRSSGDLKGEFWNTAIQHQRFWRAIAVLSEERRTWGHCSTSQAAVAGLSPLHRACLSHSDAQLEQSEGWVSENVTHTWMISRIINFPIKWASVLNMCLEAMCETKCWFNLMNSSYTRKHSSWFFSIYVFKHSREVCGTVDAMEGTVYKWQKTLFPGLLSFRAFHELWILSKSTYQHE